MAGGNLVHFTVLNDMIIRKFTIRLLRSSLEPLKIRF